MGLNLARASLILVIVNLVLEVFAVGGWILLLIAIFSRRKGKNSEVIQTEMDLS